MAKKTLNYKAKISLALSSMIKNDTIIEEFQQENSVNSNLFKRIGKKKHHYIEMEFNKYIVKTTLMQALTFGESVKPFTTKPTYKPEPDIIAHYKKRDASHIITVAECKYFDKSGIIRDYFKLWGYYFSTDIEQGQLVIYPKSGTPKPYVYRPSMFVRSLEELKSILDGWDDNEAGVIDVIFNATEAERLMSSSPDVVMYKKDEDNYVFKMDDGAIYKLDFKQNNFKVIAEDAIPGDYIEQTPAAAKETAIIKSPTYVLSELLLENNFITYQGLKTSDNPIERNTMIKYYFENEESQAPIYERKRNMFIAVYTHDYGFVFGMPKIELTDNGKTIFDKLTNLGFGYEPGKTWTYLKPKTEMHNPRLFFDFIDASASTINELIEQIAPSMKKSIGIE